MRAFVTGTGFTPGKTVTLTWQLPNGRSEPACPGVTVKVLKDGTLATTCQVSQRDRIGLRRLIGSDGNRSAATVALIISSSMQPSRRHDRFVVRR